MKYELDSIQVLGYIYLQLNDIDAYLTGYALTQSTDKNKLSKLMDIHSKIYEAFKDIYYYLEDYYGKNEAKKIIDCVDEKIKKSDK